MRSTIIQVVFGKTIPGEPQGGHSHTYTYRVPLELQAINLWPGDRVIVPPNWAHSYSQIATIVAWGRGDYEGELQEIEGIVKESRRRAAVAPPNMKPVPWYGAEYENFERRVARLERRAASASALLEVRGRHSRNIEDLQTRIKVLQDRIERLENTTLAVPYFRNGESFSLRRLKDLEH